MSFIEWKNTSAGNSKSFMLPSTSIYQLMYGYVNLVTGSIAGNRRIKFSLLDTDSTTVRYRMWNGGIAQNALSNYDYQLSTGTGPKDTNNNAGFIISISPDFIIMPGYTVQIAENNNIDPADILSVYAVFKQLS